jgi:hypothetical protein
LLVSADVISQPAMLSVSWGRVEEVETFVKLISEIDSQMVD